MKKIMLLIMLGLCLSLAGNALAQGNLGQSGANFLQIAVEPRGAALGGATTALTEGAAALYWNPAGAVRAENFDVLVAQTDWFIDTNLIYVGAVKNLGANGAIGLSATSFYMDEMEITTVEQNLGTGEYFEASNLAVGLSYARSLTDQFTFGLTGKYVEETIWNESDSQFALDVGSLYQTDFYGLCIGMSVRNFAGKLELDGDDLNDRIDELDEENENEGIDPADDPRYERLTPEYRLPQVFQIGIAFQPVTLNHGQLTFLTDVDVPSDTEERISVGMEYGFNNLLFLRGSFRINDDTSNYALGAGFNLEVANVQAHLDYSYSNHDYLENVHRFGLGFAM